MHRRNFLIGSACSTLATPAFALTPSLKQNFPGLNGIADFPFLRGVNFSGMNFTPGQQWPVEPAVDYYITQKKMNVVRFCLLWELVQPTLNGPLDAGQITGITDQITRITAAGAYVILEMHNYGRRTVNGTQYIIGETATVTSVHFSDLWSKVATRWHSNPKVIFEIMNEPHDQDSQVLVSVSNAAIAAIRATGASNLILVMGNDWGGGWGPGSNNQTYMGNIVDSLSNFAFDVHHYFDEYSEGLSPNVIANPIARMEDFTTWAKANGKRAFCGEFGASVGALAASAIRSLLTYLETNQDVYIGWEWWGGGGWWPSGYVFLLDPFASRWDATNTDPTGSVTWTDPIDRPQMKVLQEYLPATATVFNGG